MIDHFVGVDIQTARPCPYSVLDAAGNASDAGWLNRGAPEHIVAQLRAVLSKYERETIAVGIDAPRCPLPSPRQWYWQNQHWVPLGNQVGNGRHCEVVISAHGLANPQWTPWTGPFPDWMSLGFAIFRELGTEFAVHEVFPTASYSMLRSDPAARMNIRLGDFAPHPKDMLDAYVAAATVREFVQGRGYEVGGKDGFGTIVLPRPFANPIAEVMTWPAGFPNEPAGRPVARTAGLI